MQLHAVLIEDSGWHAAQCLEIDIASQGNIREEALRNLKEALTLHFQFPINSQLCLFQGDSDLVQSWDPSVVETFELKVEGFQQLAHANKASKENFDCTNFESDTFRKIRFKLEARGFTEVRQLNNHAKFVQRNNNEIRTAILPHYLQICPAVLRSVLFQAGLSKEEFDKL
ncbi:MAG: hypothetical protein K2X77_06405 [Candidatus Obscuribacterales bacterium]|jgi:predicted RNase H-like HicB family nuclease/predicted RNA binding protein YcfA (HicA-like mRNA interferase family)|nr:hypothetical protein [Candidatus Obscuribacterales bacterium]